MTIAKSETHPRVAILQSCYIPWKGYFDIIGSADIFVIYDDVQYSKNHWHNRNLIKTHSGTQWLTIPVSKGEGAFLPIDEVRISQSFAEKHWRAIEQSYARAPFLSHYKPMFENLYERASDMRSLSEVNYLFMEAITRFLGFNTRFVRSRTLASRGGQTERLVNICSELGATSYITGPSAADYMEQDRFAEAGIAIEWMDYAGYPVYKQLHGPFAHSVSILDLLFNTGPEAHKFMKAPTGDSVFQE